jgi:putative ABC transport system permease protein
VQLIAFDPDTDFAVRPWIGQALGGGGGIADGGMVVGSRVDVRTNGTILLFNREYPVAARLSPTSSGFDTSIFMTRGTMDILKANIHEAGYRLLQDGEPASSVSAILVRLRSGANAQVVASQIRRLDAEVDVIVSESILSVVSEALGGFTAYIKAVIAVVLALSVVVLAACFGGSVNERKREFAVLRLLGATRGRLASLVLAESSITALAGGAAGVALAALAVFPFSTAIGAALALPYASLGAGLIAALVAGSLALSFAAGAAAAAFSAFRIGSTETYFTMRVDG